MPVTASLLVSACVVCRADDATIPSHRPSRRGVLAAALAPRAFFAQVGAADEVTTATAGAMWSVKGDPVRSRWGIYVEASLSRWNSRGGHPSESGVLTQLAAVP
jgi:hypothetical protein